MQPPGPSGKTLRRKRRSIARPGKGAPMPVRNTSNLACTSSNPSSRPLRRLALTSLLACSLVGLAATSALSAIACKPLLSIKNVREIRAASIPIQPWVWKAAIAADTSYCATGSGRFEIDFIRIKEYAPDMQFAERYSWSAGQFDVTIELTADESIHDYRIGFIVPCICANFHTK
jgi:hypothetical protein